MWTAALGSDSPSALVCSRVLEVARRWHPSELAGSCGRALVSDSSRGCHFHLPTPRHPDKDRIPNAQSRCARPCQAGCGLCCLRTQRDETRRGTGPTTWRVDGGLTPGAGQDPACAWDCVGVEQAQVEVACLENWGDNHGAGAIFGGAQGSRPGGRGVCQRVGALLAVNLTMTCLCPMSVRAQPSSLRCKLYHLRVFLQKLNRFL